MKYSIRYRLLLGLTVALVTIWIAVVVATYHGAKNEIGALFDTQLEQSARVATRTLLGLPDSASSNTKPRYSEETDTRPVREQYKKNLAVQVWDEDGNLFLSSRNAPVTPISNVREGFSDVIVDGKFWRAFSFEDGHHGLTIQAGEPYAARSFLTQHIVMQTLYPLMAGLPLIAVLIWFAVGRGLRPLRRIAMEVARRDPQHLGTINVPNIPDEVRPLVTEINSLLRKLVETLEKERQFTGNAAHELRTPLAGLRAQCEVALSARNWGEAREALPNIMTGVDRAVHLVNQLLTLSRLDETGELRKECFSLSAITERVVSDLSHIVGSKCISIELQLAPNDELLAYGNEDTIYVLLRNLIDNAIRYSPTGSRVSIRHYRIDEDLFVEVLDQGAGIPQHYIDRVFDRFYRGKRDSSYGTGLGLSIVKRVAELHGGEVTLAEVGGAGGLRAKFRLPIDRHQESPARADSARLANAVSQTKLNPIALSADADATA